jgi:hypothetical protein
MSLSLSRYVHESARMLFHYKPYYASELCSEARREKGHTSAKPVVEPWGGLWSARRGLVLPDQAAALARPAVLYDEKGTPGCLWLRGSRN